MAREKENMEKVELPVAFGSVSIGKTSARLGVSVHAGKLTPTKANNWFVGSRLTGTIIARLGKGQPDQASIPGLDKDPKIKGVFDVKSVGMTPTHYNFGLTFSLDKLDIEQLSHFAGREGVLTITDVDDIPEPEDGGESMDEDDDE